MRSVFDSTATPPLLMSTLKLPVVKDPPEPVPSAMLLLPVVFPSAFALTAVLLLPVLPSSAFAPMRHHERAVTREAALVAAPHRQLSAAYLYWQWIARRLPAFGSILQRSRS
jgi:hypothetical protein